MLGELVVSFYEPGSVDLPRWLEVWAFPGGTLQLVIASESTLDSQEYMFPCAAEHIRNVLTGYDYQTTSPAGYVMLRRQGNAVIAEFERCEDSEPTIQEIAVADFRDAITQVPLGVPYLG